MTKEENLKLLERAEESLEFYSMQRRAYEVDYEDARYNGRAEVLDWIAEQIEDCREKIFEIELKIDLLKEGIGEF